MVTGFEGLRVYIFLSIHIVKLIDIEVFFLDASFANIPKHYLPDFFFCLQLILLALLHSWCYIVMCSADEIFGGYLPLILKRLCLIRYVLYHTQKPFTVSLGAQTLHNIDSKILN